MTNGLLVTKGCEKFRGLRNKRKPRFYCGHKSECSRVIGFAVTVANGGMFNLVRTVNKI